METAKFIKKIWIAMGKPEVKEVATQLGVKRVYVQERLALLGRKCI